jgi:arylsulfatase A-like enzyme
MDKIVKMKNRGQFGGNLGILTSVFIFGSGSVLNTAAQTETPQPFRGVIGKTLAESKPGNHEFKGAPQGAPNVVWILLDDVGFGASSAFGGLIQTPAIDSLANNGLRYSNFHTQAYCAPTRAALLTGRNHHSVHMGLFPETAQEFPGYDGRIPFEKAFISEILKENGYNTFAVGKWHVTPVHDVTQAGPFNRWPTGRGFDHYYGFLYAETDQVHPQLFEDVQKTEPENNGKYLNTLFADKAISYIANQKSAAPDKPFFLYFATGATHEPHQVEQKWRDLYKGKFDKGWDWYRNEVLKNQKKLGLVPPNAELPVRNPGVSPWDSLSQDERKTAARFFENYAGFISETDYEIGRVIHFIKKTGQLDNTVIFLIIGDNGASGEGTETGYVQGFNSPPKNRSEHVKYLLDNIDRIGTDESKAHYPSGWAQATSTPFRLTKSFANAEGGTHNPLIVFWPKGIKDKGGIRNQYSHIIDVLPTTVELTHATIPAAINGYKQEPVEGFSFFSSFSNAGAESGHKVQYYEAVGRRAIYKDGWKAGAGHVDGTDIKKDTWELYNISEDFNERNNLASKNPGKLKELQDLFDSEARKYNVYPLKDWNESPWDGGTNIFNGSRKIVLYPGVSQFFGLAGPLLFNRPFSITADVEISSAEKTEGVLFAYSGSFGGISLFIKGGKFQVALNSNREITHVVSDKPVPAGNAKLRLDFNYINSSKPTDPAGSAVIYINGVKAGELPIAKYQSDLLAYNEGIDVGKDLNTPVSDRYTSPYEFRGILNSITIEYPK